MSFTFFEGPIHFLCWCGQLAQVPKPRLASSHWLGHLPSLASPAATLLYKIHLNQALLSGATVAAGRCAGSLFPPKM